MKTRDLNQLSVLSEKLISNRDLQWYILYLSLGIKQKLLNLASRVFQVQTLIVGLTVMVWYTNYIGINDRWWFIALTIYAVTTFTLSTLLMIWLYKQTKLTKDALDAILTQLLTYYIQNTITESLKEALMVAKGKTEFKPLPVMEGLLEEFERKEGL